jgi:stage II sporulation protein AA (anti-sigma F factor antagonist)
MDSSGIGMIIGRYKLINDKGGRIVIININQKLRRIFDMSGLHKLIKIFDSVDAALHYLTEEVA